jgi:AraC family transcriptional activator of pobA
MAMDKGQKKLDFSDMATRSRMAENAPAHVPFFFLYGEQRRRVAPRFLHIESLDDRSRPADWTIRAHAHANLNQLFCISAGSGLLSADGAMLRFDAPCVLIVPARTVHAISYTPDAAGWVMTIADAYMRELAGREPMLGAVFETAQCRPAEEADLEAAMRNLAREAGWHAPAAAAAAEGCLLIILAMALRLLQNAGPAMRTAGPAAELVTRLHDLIEAHYREAVTVAALARRLQVSEAQLRRACLAVTGLAPAALLQERIFEEARRLLLYTNMSVAAAAHYLGFADAAYFSRFFAKQAGQSPREFRRLSREAFR